MKTVVVSYSLTGNNDALAARLADQLSAAHVRVTEPRPRNNGTIALDMLLNRTPKIEAQLESCTGCDLTVFVAPVWMGQVAAPLRACFKELKPRIGQYAFVSISGGADGANPKLASELQKRLAREPAAVIDLHIADLLPPEPKPTRNDTSAYRISEQDVKRLIDTVVATLRTVIPDW